MRAGRKRYAIAPAAAGVGLTLACAVAVRTPELHAPASPPPPSEARSELKVHLKSGELLVLREWSLAGEASRIEGIGQRYAPTRERVGPEERQSVPMDSVALLETNSQRNVYPFAAQSLAVLTVFWGTITGICVADPKSCFGSCPTFYREGDSRDAPAAEGFSASIARVLEQRDVDALGPLSAERGRVALLMRNEALEVHSVQRVRLLAAERPRGGRVLASSDGRFFAALDPLPPVRCRDAEGNCLEAVRLEDGLERSSAADGEDLATRETLELEFPRVEGPLGLVIGARQSLLSTFLFYQTMAYAGSRGGELLARIESGPPGEAERAMGMARVLGGIDAEVAFPEGWREIGSYRETGPIAVDSQVLAFDPPPGDGPLRVRLRLAKGNWRLSHVALAQLQGERAPVAIELRSVERDGRKDEAALAALRDAARYLVTLPGDQYRLEFELPAHLAESELFLESEGYYYEWQRSEWLAEEDPLMLGLILTRPDEALRRLAGPFKAQEGRLEQSFWQSRFRR